MADGFYWVYLPEIDEAGTVVQAASFEDAFKQGCEALYPDDGVEVQVHELGESREFRAGEPTAEDELRAERDRLRIVLDANGGRGVEVAERIDQIDKELGESEHLKQFRVSGTFSAAFVIEVSAENADDAADLVGQLGMGDYDATSCAESEVEDVIELDANGEEVTDA